MEYGGWRMGDGKVFFILLYLYNFEMVLGVGLVSSIIVYKSRSSYKTRLEKLQSKLGKKPLKQVTFYEAPTKKIITIFIIIVFILASMLF